jgi:TolB-like protein/tRNA A-37 threonylcarbamoyl transferase component Bud32
VATADLERLQSALGPGYTVERELGSGGMATVYLARDAKHQRQVALKVLHPDLAVSLGPERFRREITTAAQLQHPHILGVYDSGETATGQLWFTMPFVEGESLRDRLRREAQLPVGDAIRITREVASALAYAHGRGIVHRDIKPENVLLTGQGDALLADFGIARALSANASDTGLTATGLAVGTPQYMSPEQASGERTLDARSDVYSLGALLYEMLAGEPPFTGPSAQAVIAKMLSSAPPSVRGVRPTVSASVDAAIQRALAPVPADRWPSATEFAHALEVAERTAAAPVVPAGGPAPTRRMPVAAMALGLGFLIGIGVLFAWRSRAGSGAAPGDAGPIRIAVLPFDNMGDSADGYFADGVTDAVRGKLTSMPGLAVIGSASSGQYRHTTKAPREIAQELGVHYLLLGKVRWDKHTGGESQVEVSPELVDGPTATDRWAQPFDASLTHVFQVQGEIADKVAQALQVALTPATQQAVEARPTADLGAYDSYLRGLAITRTSNSPQVLRQAIAALRDAVTRDSAFALAWSRLATNYSLLYFNSMPLRAVADSSDRASARALALAPGLPEAHAARGAYFSLVLHDQVRGLVEAKAGLALAPANTTLLITVAAGEAAAGLFDSAAVTAARAAALDPRDASVFRRVASIAMARRRSVEAQAAAERALALQPGNLPTIDALACILLQQGDLAGARRMVERESATAGLTATAAYLGNYYDLGWVLDSALSARLLATRPDAFFADTGTWAIVLAQQYGFAGDRARQRAYADTARAAFSSELAAATEPDPQRHMFLGLALAYLGRDAEAVKEGERGIAIASSGPGGRLDPYFDHQLARVYLAAGQPERALDTLERLLAEPYFVTPAWLRIDPNFAPLRGNPRFERLAAGAGAPIA